MNLDQAIELEGVQMEVFRSAIEYRKSGDLRRYFSGLAIAKYMNKYLNKFFSGKDFPISLYDEFVEAAIEEGELSIDKAEEFDRYGKRKVEFLVSLFENPHEIIGKAKINADEFRESVKLGRSFKSKN
ncbi:hypothetical protein COU57_06235 [Candidatus Pacearchaeota archaeon CG10_big_fil_rev_8_21_14_0_10_32_14]|nr:MAG: hypothetical protein COU57_06235 [Candidatus Pacearchaeota archaeon CG10_big_fil_rev_8_21_14_0_10_32_14]